MNGRWGDRGVSETTVLVLMAIAAVLLAMSVVTSLSGGNATGEADRPRASFVFEANGSDLTVTHYGGDRLNASRVYVESADRGVLGNFNGTDGAVCATPVRNLTVGAACLVPNAAYERVYVVWRGPGGDRLILDRYPAAPTPSPTPTATPTATPTPTVTPTVTATPTTATPGPGTTVPPGTANGTATPGGDGTATPNGTAAPDTPTGTPGGTDTAGGTGTPTPTPVPAGTPANTDASLRSSVSKS